MIIHPDTNSLSFTVSVTHMLTLEEKNYMWGRRPSSSHGNTTISLAIIIFACFLPSLSLENRMAEYNLNTERHKII
jgi:hypothetical protein